MARYEYKYRKPQRRHFSFGKFLFALLFTLALIYPFYEATQLDIDEHTVAISNLPSNLRNLRIVFASDIHQCAWFPQERVNKLISTINGLSADIVILGGDYADDSDGAIAFFSNAPAIQARVGVYGILGNHDRTLPESNLSVLTSSMMNYGCLPLVNSVARVKIGKSYLMIAGVDDYYNGFPDVAGVASQVNGKDTVIFVGHTPDLIPDMLKATAGDGDIHWFDMALFGHTHGGQVNLLGWSPFAKLEPAIGSRYLSGWREENRATLLVSNGIGTSGAPVRLFAKPKLHVIKLTGR